MERVVAFLNSHNIVPENIIASLSSIDWQSSLSKITETVTSGVGSALSVAFAAISSVFSVASTVLIGFIFALYLLLDKDRLTKQFKTVSESIIPERYLSKLLHIAEVANESFHKFIVGQCTEAVILGTLCMVGMFILRLPYAPMIGALIAFTALIPIVGAFIGAGLGAFLIFVESPSKAIVFLVFIIILQQLEGNLIYPKVVGSSLGLPGIWVLAAVTIGGGVMGIPGMLIGVPFMAVIYKLTVEAIHEKRVLNSPTPSEKEGPEEN
jgi:predicted PurR-regulated permease PerM